MKLYYKLTLFCMLLLLIIPFTLKDIKATTIAEGEYYPLGINYLNPNYFSMFKESDTIYTAEWVSDFRIRSATTYSIETLNPADSYLTSINTIFYDKNKVQIQYDMIINSVIENGKIVKMTFETPIDAYYIHMSIEFVHLATTPPIIIDDFYILYEGESYPTGVSTKYLGPDGDLVPVISGLDGFYYTNCNSPISVEQIKSSLTAIDDVDGDITNQIVIADDQYTANKFIVGTYLVTFQVTDSSANSSNFNIHITVVDDEAPVITGPSQIDVSPTELLGVENIINQMTVTDNYDTSLIIAFENDTYTPNYNVLGDYSINLYAVDAALNRTDFLVTIHVVDRTAPIFAGPAEIIKSNNSYKTIQEILTQYQAIDDFEGDLSSQIIVIYDNYSYHTNRVGTWNIELQVSDSSLNTSKKTVSIIVQDKTGPVFYINKTVVTIELTNNNLGVTSIISTLQDSKVINEDAKITILEDEYSKNKTTPGTYKVLLESNQEQMELTVNVVNDEFIEEVKELNIFEKIIQFLVNIFNAISNFFKNLFA